MKNVREILDGFAGKKNQLPAGDAGRFPQASGNQQGERAVWIRGMTADLSRLISPHAKAGNAR